MRSDIHEELAEEVDRLYAQAAAAGQAGRHQEAAETWERIIGMEPRIPNVFWNLGLARAQLDQHDRALAAWDVYRAMVPDDWRARVRLIQSCQALGDTARRDRERQALLALREAGTDTELLAEPHYCREQFRVGGHAVVAYEVFEPTGPMRVFYVFLVGQPDGAILGRYSLGSYDFTTQGARERGELGPHERLYHLDWYARDLHSTQGFYRSLPGYDQVRADVVAALTGARGPVSYGVPPATGDPHDAPSHARAAAPAPAAPAHDRGRAPAGTLDRISAWAARLLRRPDAR